MRAINEYERPWLKGETNGNAKLTETDVQTIRARKVKGHRMTDMAREYGVGYYTIRDCCDGTTWGWLD